MVALLTSVRNSPCFGGLRRTKTCHRQLFARPSMLFGYFLHDAKSDKPFPLQRTSRFCKPRISAPEQQLLTNKIKTFPKGASRFCKPRISSLKRQLRTNPIKSFFRLTAVLFLLFVKHKKQGKKNFPFGKFFHLHPLHRQFRHNIVVHKSPQEQPTQSVSVCAEGFHEP